MLMRKRDLEPIDEVVQAASDSDSPCHQPCVPTMSAERRSYHKAQLSRCLFKFMEKPGKSSSEDVFAVSCQVENVVIKRSKCTPRTLSKAAHLA